MDDVFGSNVQIHVLVDLCRLCHELSILLFLAAPPSIVHGLEEPSNGICHSFINRGHEGIEEHSAHKD